MNYSEKKIITSTILHYILRVLCSVAVELLVCDNNYATLFFRGEETGFSYSSISNSFSKIFRYPTIDKYDILKYRHNDLPVYVFDNINREVI